MPSDDFMAEINEVVSAAETGAVTTKPVVTPDVTANNEVVTNADNSDLENKLLDIMKSPQEIADEKAAKQRETLKLKEKPKTDEPDKSVTTDVTEVKQATTEPTEKLPYLDRFLRQDKDGNLIVGDGVIIATAGASRTYYENMKKEGRAFRAQAEQLAVSNFELGKQFKSLFNEFEAMKNTSPIKALETQTGMTTVEIQDAVAIMKQYKTDPVTAIKSLLTQASMRGIDLKSIGINGGIDAATVQRAIENAIESRLSSQQATAKDPATQAQEAALQEAQEFLDAFPDAIPHADIIAKAKDRFPDKSLPQLWAEFIRWQRKQQEVEQEKQYQSRTEQQPQQQRQPQRQQPITKVVTPAKRYEHMSYAEIAADLANNGV